MNIKPLDAPAGVEITDIDLTAELGDRTLEAL